jgi:hypothetical protein
MVIRNLTGREFWWGGGVQGVRAKQDGILFTMIFYMSILGWTNAPQTFPGRFFCEISFFDQLSKAL